MFVVSLKPVGTEVVPGCTWVVLIPVVVSANSTKLSSRSRSLLGHGSTVVTSSTEAVVEADFAVVVSTTASVTVSSVKTSSAKSLVSFKSP